MINDNLINYYYILNIKMNSSRGVLVWMWEGKLRAGLTGPIVVNGSAMGCFKSAEGNRWRWFCTVRAFICMMFSSTSLSDIHLSQSKWSLRAGYHLDPWLLINHLWVVGPRHINSDVDSHQMSTFLIVMFSLISPSHTLL